MLIYFYIYLFISLFEVNICLMHALFWVNLCWRATYCREAPLTPCESCVDLSTKTCQQAVLRKGLNPFVSCLNVGPWPVYLLHLFIYSMYFSHSWWFIYSTATFKGSRGMKTECVVNLLRIKSDLVELNSDNCQIPAFKATCYYFIWFDLSCSLGWILGNGPESHFQTILLRNSLCPMKSNKVEKKSDFFFTWNHW